MPPDADAQHTESSGPNGRSALLWDMAGTLIPYDPRTGRPGALPGCDEFLPELGRDFRLLVTTGDTTAGARGLLRDFELLRYFEAVYGDLFGPLGKPYGAILRQLGAEPRRSLAIGDRLRADVAGDTDQVVTVLINQDGQIVNAGQVGFLIGRLRRRHAEFPAAFDAMAGAGEPAPGAEGEWQGGTVTAARVVHDGFPIHLRRFRHPALEGDRRVIVI